MVARWNPSDPTRVGLEFEPTSWGSKSLRADTAVAVQTIRAAATETVDGIQAIVQPDRYGGFLLGEVYIAGSEVVTDVLTSIFLPTADAVRNAVTGPDGVTTTNLFSWVNDTNPRDSFTGGPDPDYLIAQGGASAAYYIARHSGLTGALTGRRILAVRMVSIAQGFPGFPSPWAHLMWRGTDGLNYFPGVGRYLPNNSAPTLITEMTYNPQTGRPWLLSELQAMGGVTNNCGVGIQFGYGASGPSAGVIHTLGIEVVHCPENRVAFGVSSVVPAVVPGGTAFVSMGLVTPAGATTFSKSSGNDYTLVLRRRAEPADNPPPSSVGINEFRADALPPETGFESPTGNAGWAHYGNAVANPWGGLLSLGDPTQTVWPLALRVPVSFQAAADQQGYAYPLLAAVYSGRPARQYVTPTGASTVALVRVAVRPATNAGVADLTITLRRAADNVVIGSAGTLTRAQWDAGDPLTRVGTFLGKTVKYIHVPLGSSGAVSGATQYYIEFTSTATGVTGTSGRDAWEVLGLQCSGSMQLANYGGITDYMVRDGFHDNASDSPASFFSAPTAPATATLSTFDETNTDDGTTCWYGATVPFPRVSWSATSLGVAFGSYQVQRREPSLAADWFDIGTLTVENPGGGPSWVDFEARRNVAAEYRVRVLRADGGFSAWRTATGSITPTLPGCGLLLTSNQSTRVVARSDTGERAWEFLNAGDVKTVRIYGRDYQVAFTSLAFRGVRWQLDLIMFGRGDQNTAPPVNAHNWDQFDSLDSWNVFGIATCCLLTTEGQRLWGTLRLLSGRRSPNEAHLYVATVEFVESQDVPPIVERASVI